MKKVKFLTTFITFLSFLLLLVGCANIKVENATVANASNEKQEVQKVEAAASNEKQKITSEEAKFKIGEAGKLGEYQFTVNSVTTSDSKKIWHAQDGNKLITINGSFENLSNEQYGVTTITLFKLSDVAGKTYNMCLGGDSNGRMDGLIGAGKKVTGEVTFEVPAALTEAQLEIHPVLSSKETIKYTLQIPEK